MSTLVADSGSTKTRWAVASGEGMVTVTAGLNPRVTGEADFHAAVRQMLDALPAASEAGEVWFYGAGCGTEEMQTRVAAWLGEDLPGAAVHVAGDLLGACRAVCGDEAGLVGILGTGSNLCHYDGIAIDRQCPSTGFLLGDEGSGNHIGRRLVKDYLEGAMPADLRDQFADSFPMTYEGFLESLYQRPYPNRFLASFVPFAAAHRNDPYVAALVADCFDAFMTQVSRHHLPATEPLHLVGGLTAAFPAELHAAAMRATLTLATLTLDPLEGMLRYHS